MGFLKGLVSGEDAHRVGVGHLGNAAQARVRVDEALCDGDAQMPPSASAIEQEEVAGAWALRGGEARLVKRAVPNLRRDPPQSDAARQAVGVKAVAKGGEADAIKASIGTGPIEAERRADDGGRAGGGAFALIHRPLIHRGTA